MAERIPEAGSAPDLKDSGDGKIESDGESVAASEKSDSGRGSSTEKPTIQISDSGCGSSTEKPTIQISEAPGAEAGKESAPSSFEPPRIVEHPVEGAEASGGVESTPVEKSPRRSTFLSRARDIAAKGVKAIARSLSPKIEPVGSPRKSPSSRSPQKLKTSLSPEKKGQSEDEGILSGSELRRQSSEQESLQELSDTPRKSIVQRCKSKILGGKKTSPCSQESTDAADSAGHSGESPYKRLTAKEKRSRFAGLLNLSRSKTDSHASPKRLVWTSQGAAFETSRSDTTEELDIGGSVSSPGRPEEEVPAEEIGLAEVVPPLEERGAPEGVAEDEPPQQEDPKIGGFKIGGRFGDYYFSNE